jgi:hypothetical protein
MPGGGQDAGAGSGFGGGNSGPAGGASSGGNYGGNSNSNQSSSSNDGYQNVHQTGAVTQTPGATSPDDDGRLNYLSGAYQDIKLSQAQKDKFAEDQKQANYAISPMSKPSNVAIGVGLNLLLPGAGYLFGHYKNSTAMGYSMTNPLSGLKDKFGNAKDWVGDKFGGLLDGPDANFNTSGVGDGSDNNRTTMNTIAPLAPYAVSGITPQESQASKWYASIGENTGSTFNFAGAYADAKTKVAANLSSHGPLAQLAVSDSPYYNWLKTNKLDKGIL